MLEERYSDAPWETQCLCRPSFGSSHCQESGGGGWAGWDTSTLLYLSATTESIWMCQSPGQVSKQSAGTRTHTHKAVGLREKLWCAPSFMISFGFLMKKLYLISDSLALYCGVIIKNLIQLKYIRDRPNKTEGWCDMMWYYRWFRQGEVLLIVGESLNLVHCFHHWDPRSLSADVSYQFIIV